MKNYFNNMSLMTKLLWLASAILVTFLIFNGMAHAAIAMASAGAIALEDVTAEFSKKSKELGAAADEMRTLGAELKAKSDSGEKVSQDLKDTVDKAMLAFNTLKTDFTAIEQKVAGASAAVRTKSKTWGEQITGSTEFKSFQERGGRSTMTHEVKLGPSLNDSTAAGGLITSYRETDVVNLIRERRVMRDLIRTIPVNTSSVDYPVQLARINNAAPVAEAASKPYSNYTWSAETVNLRTLAHLAKLTRQALDDAPRLVGEIDQEMRYGLGLLEESQFLYGNGLGQNLAGIVPQATAFAKPVGYTDLMGTRIDVLRLAMLQVSLALLPADGIVLNEADWAMIELTKIDNGAYLFAQPQGRVSASMWGLPVVPTPAMVAGDFLVGSFQMGATIYDRMGVEVLISTENDKDFEQNLATMRAEERVAIAVKRPQAFITGDFGTAITSIKA